MTDRPHKRCNLCGGTGKNRTGITMKVNEEGRAILDDPDYVPKILRFREG